MSDLHSSFSTQQPVIAHPSDLLSRRGLLSTLSLAGTALYASTLTARAGWFGSKNEDMPVVTVKTARNSSRKPSQKIGGFDKEWVKLEGRNINDYANYINSLKLRNISAQEVLDAHAKEHGNVWNRIPPRYWWARMGYTLQVVDRISSAMKSPVKEIISAYRTPQYNAKCRGAKRQSWHQANIAVDFRFDASPRQVSAAARSLRDRGLFKGGIGSYSSFTHIDTRGQNISW